MDKKKDKHSLDKGVNDMTEMTLTVNNFSLSEFIKQNKTKIDAITPKNPTIKKDDEWYNEDCWDKLFKEKSGK